MIDFNNHPNLIKDENKSFKFCDELKPYLMEFEANGTMKDMISPENC